MRKAVSRAAWAATSCRAASNVERNLCISTFVTISRGFQGKAAVNVVLRLRLFDGKRRHDLFRRLHDTGETFAIHLGVESITAEEIRLEVQESDAIGLGTLAIRRGARLMLAEIDEMFVVDAGIFYMGDERAARHHRPDAIG